MYVYITRIAERKLGSEPKYYVNGKEVSVSTALNILYVILKTAEKKKIRCYHETYIRRNIMITPLICLLP